MSREPFTPGDTAPESVRIFGVILRALVQVVGRLFYRRPEVALVMPLHIWFNRAVKRLERAMTRPVVAPSAAAVGDARERGARKARVRFPSRRGWLRRECGWEIGGYVSQLRHLLEQPEMQEALATRPAVGRILRPICRTLGVEVPGLARVVVAVVKPRKPRAARPARERPWEPGRTALRDPNAPWMVAPGAKRGVT